MRTFLTKLFPGRRDRARRRAAAPVPARRARLGVETLDNRIMPAVTSSLSNGLLTVTGDAADDEVAVWYSGSAQNLVHVQDFTTGKTTSYNASLVNRVAMYGGDGHDCLNNNTMFPTTFNGGNGTDTLDGGYGNDVFLGSPGMDMVIGMQGRDVFHRNGYDGSMADASPAEGDLVVGLVNGRRLNSFDLDQTGNLVASLDPTNPRRLILNGPSGAGFVLESGWKTDTTGFATSSPITFQTYYGNVTLPNAGATVRVNTTGMVGGAGVYSGISWGGVGVTGTTNPLNGLLDTATGDIGLDVNLPGLTWGIGLGTAVKQLDSDAPVNDAVPYLYAHVGGGASISYSGAEVSSPQSFSGTVVFSPWDGTVYVAASGMPVVTDFAVGVSPTGYLPYTPDRTPGGVSGTGIYGHYYARGAIDLGDAGVPVEVRGEVVVDLDANDDGNLIGMSSGNIGSVVSQFFSGITSATTFRNTATSVMNDIAVGFNGGLSLSVSALSLDLGSASAWYRPGQIAFRAATTNPFDGIPVLEKLGTGGGTFDIQGTVNWNTRPGSTAPVSWWFRADTASSNFGGLSAGNLYLEAGSWILGGGGLRAGATVSGLMGAGSISVTGTIGFDGSFSLAGEAKFSSSIDWGTFHAGVDFRAGMSIGWNNATQTFTFAGSVYASAWAKLDGVGEAGITFQAGLTITVTGGQVNFVAYGSITAWIDLVIAPRAEFTVGFVLTNDSLTLQLPGLKDATFEW